ncbi:hypothetical protein OVA30_15755 [Methylorubrum sp. SL192]|nr:hypothetical protein [Methylorubrum sp. SL192]
MTAEIVIINQQAVALAADSAVTIGKNKVWKHANKLFSFGPNNEIGIMIYNSGDFIRVPWEVVVKEFRTHVGGRVFSTLRAFTDEFVGFVKSSKFSDPHYELLSFGLIFADVMEKLNDNFDYENRVELQANLIADIRHQETALVNFAELPIPFEYEKFKKKFGSLIKSLAREEFKLRIGRQPLEVLTRFLFDIIRHEVHSEYYTGVVIAGYGRNELFPSVHHQIFDGKALGITRCWQSSKCVDLNAKGNPGAAIIPFAQSDMAHLFVEGIAPQYLKFLSETFSGVIKERSHNIIDNLIGDPDQRLVEKHLQDKESESMQNAFKAAFEGYRRKAFINPILETIRALPKEEMAYMARAMVEITALRRRFASNVESVGGEIDVAVISKSDGFVWINRKHYFDIDLNPDFVERKSMLRGGKNGTGDRQARQAWRARRKSDT